MAQSIRRQQEIVNDRDVLHMTFSAIARKHRMGEKEARAAYQRYVDEIAPLLAPTRIEPKIHDYLDELESVRHQLRQIAARADNDSARVGPNGALESRTYDAAGRLTQVKHSIGQTILAQLDYAYDAGGNPTTITTPTGVSTYGYDARDRLTSVCYQSSCPGASDPFIRWTYDAVGNRLTEARPSGTTTYTYDAGDELTAAGSTAYTYDANGDETAAGSRTFGWNVAGQLTSTAASGNSTNYAYDGDGNRLQTASTSTMNYFWDVNASLPRLAVERRSGTAIRSYTYGIGLLSMAAGGQTYTFHRDGLGSVINLTSSIGQTEWTYSYEPYGAPRVTTKNDPNAPDTTQRFAGQLLDSDSGLYDLRARSYDGSTGRFMSVDERPADALAPLASSYVYGDDRPTTMIDPSGFGPVWAVASKESTTNAYNPLKGIAAILNGPCAPPADAIPKNLSGILLGAWVRGWEEACQGEKATLSYLVAREEATIDHPWSFDFNVTLPSPWGVITFGFQWGNNGVHPYVGFGPGEQASFSWTFSNSPANSGLYGVVGGCGGGACGSISTQGNVDAGTGFGTGGSYQVRWGVP